MNYTAKAVVVTDTSTGKIVEILDIDNDKEETGGYDMVSVRIVKDQGVTPEQLMKLALRIHYGNKEHAKTAVDHFFMDRKQRPFGVSWYPGVWAKRVYLEDIDGMTLGKLRYEVKENTFDWEN